jgi:small conductance mechanosensitive channel
VLVQTDLDDPCGDDPRMLCQWVFQRSDSEMLAEAAEWLVDRPLRIAVLLAAGWLVSRVLRRSVRRFGERAAERGDRELKLLERGRQPGTALPEHANGRAKQRAKTMTSVLSSLVTALVWTATGLLVLGQIGISVAPLLAGAGVLGVILAFGAQSIVADFLAGIFMLTEDQFGVGDIVDVGEVSGVVEKVSLRVTTLRDVHGTVWHVPNSEIHRVANKSQLWSRAVLDIEVAYDTDLRRAEGIIQRVADELWRDVEFTGGDIIDPPEVWGIERLGPDGVAIRLVVKTDPAEQWVVARELRLRIKEALDEAGIEIPFPQRTIWVRHDAPVPREERPRVQVAPVRQPAISDELVENPSP